MNTLNNRVFITGIVTFGALTVLCPDVYGVNGEGVVENFNTAATQLINTIKGTIIPVIMWSGFAMGGFYLVRNKTGPAAMSGGVGVIAKLGETVLENTYAVLI